MKQSPRLRVRIRVFLSVCWTVDLWPLTGPDGGRRGQRAALHVGGELPHGEWHRQELGRHEAPVGLHLRPRETQHQLTRLQNPSDGAAHEPNQEQRKDHRGGSQKNQTWQTCHWWSAQWTSWVHVSSLCVSAPGDVWNIPVHRSLYRHPGRPHALRSRCVCVRSITDILWCLHRQCCWAEHTHSLHQHSMLDIFALVFQACWLESLWILVMASLTSVPCTRASRCHTWPDASTSLGGTLHATSSRYQQNLTRTNVWMFPSDKCDLK